MQAHQCDLDTLRNEAAKLGAATSTATHFVQNPVQFEQHMLAQATAAMRRPARDTSSALAAAARAYARLRVHADTATAPQVAAPIARLCAASTAVASAARMHILHASRAWVFAERAAAAVRVCAARAQAAACIRARDGMHMRGCAQRSIQERIAVGRSTRSIARARAVIAGDMRVFARTQLACSREAQAAKLQWEAHGRGDAIGASQVCLAASVRGRDAFRRSCASAAQASEGGGGVPAGTEWGGDGKACAALAGAADACACVGGTLLMFV